MQWLPIKHREPQNNLLKGKRFSCNTLHLDLQNTIKTKEVRHTPYLTSSY